MPLTDAEQQTRTLFRNLPRKTKAGVLIELAERQMDKEKANWFMNLARELIEAGQKQTLKTDGIYLDRLAFEHLIFEEFKMNGLEFSRQMQLSPMAYYKYANGGAMTHAIYKKFKKVFGITSAQEEELLV